MRLAWIRGGGIINFSYYFKLRLTGFIKSGQYLGTVLK